LVLLGTAALLDRGQRALGLFLRESNLLGPLCLHRCAYVLVGFRLVDGKKRARRDSSALLLQLPELDTADLAAARLRQVVDELDLARVLVRRRHVAAVLLQLPR